MEELTVETGYSVGLFKFGMKEEEVEHINKIYIEKYNRYENTFSFEYDEEGRVIYIHLIVYDLKNRFHCNFKGIDVINTKAQKLITHFDAISPYIRNSDASVGCMYEFPKLGITFWRGDVCTEEDLEADWFKELHPEIQEDTKKFLYFETVKFHKDLM
ncbi:hypothetical protein [Sporosarcina sp. Te-1]|uniref:hypothetical protein n=1 Tax=Sporosarcina sp. Te-1 TaxID=2818390 RepID=UPI001A9F61ED|nr:hypothetical protein [Sporosarcina sp. Te-1]QTD42509.1 hypothetical protein J3U78_06785 [Sporosarcina sp. Te-1]